eukprot:GFUD01038045.1.p1 GENE.GFUD01038045.1~~GFUD01038045.1.p1  ORF type:complete len:386 (-),score=81.35 GFUD01038045.1:2-1159(-)
MDVWNLPELIRIEIFLHLSGVNLHTCRQVCQEWNRFIIKELWGSQAGRKKLNKKLENQWRFSNPREFETIKGFSFDIEDKTSLVLLGMTDTVAVVRKTTKHSERNLDIHLTVVESNKNWEVSIEPTEDFEIFYRAEITDNLIVAVTDLGTVAVWDRHSHNILYSQSHPVFEFSLSVRCDRDSILIWNELTEEFIVLEHAGHNIREKCKSHNDANETYILDFVKPHFLTESKHGIQVWNMDLDSNISLTDSIELDRFGLELGVLFYPFVALTVGHNVIDGWMDGWSLQIWSLETKECLRKLPGAGYITDIKYCSNKLVLSRKVEDVPKVIIYDAEELTSESTNPWSRNFTLDNVAAKISISKTSIYLSEFDSCTVRLSCWNFWTSL